MSLGRSSPCRHRTLRLCCDPLLYDMGLSSLKLRCNPTLACSPPGDPPPPVHGRLSQYLSPAKALWSQVQLLQTHSPSCSPPLKPPPPTRLFPKLVNISRQLPFLFPSDPTVVLGLQDSVQGGFASDSYGTMRGLPCPPGRVGIAEKHLASRSPQLLPAPRAGVLAFMVSLGKGALPLTPK